MGAASAISKSQHAIRSPSRCPGYPDTAGAHETLRRCCRRVDRSACARTRSAHPHHSPSLPSATAGRRAPDDNLSAAASQGMKREAMYSWRLETVSDTQEQELPRSAFAWWGVGQERIFVRKE